MTQDENAHRDPHGSPADPAALIDDVVEHAKGWISAQKDFTTLSVSERIGRLSGSFVVLLLSTTFISVALILCGFALGTYLGEVLHDPAMGFLCSASLFLVIGLLIFYLARKPIQDLVTLHIINAVQDED